MHSVPRDLESAATAQRLADTVLPTRHGRFRMTAYRGGTGTEHVALSVGVHDDDPPGAPAPLVRLHSECLTGDALGSHRCDCGEQLQHALHLLAACGRGVLVYVRGHEGRGIGLAEKLRAYALQDAGLDTVDANLRLGHLPDARTYDEAAAVLADLGVRRLRLLTSNPAKESALRALGVDVVERVPIVVPPRPENARYLRTKRERMGHDPGEDDWQQLLEGTVPRSGELAERYGDLVRRDGPLVLAQLGQSLDGFIASRSGDARSVTGPADREHLHRLRALVDAVIVGGRTAAVDDPRLTVRDVVGPDPVRVVLDPGATLPLTSHLLCDGVAPTLWLVRASAPVPADLAEHVEVVRWHAAGPMAPDQVLQELRRRGLGRVLVEGGGRLVSAFVDAGLVDRLYLTTAPVIIGEGVPGLRVAAAETMAGATRAPVRRWVLGEDVVVEVDLAAERVARTDRSPEDHGADEVEEVSSSTA
ncbi:GTP cyclohydrolase II [Ornithinimicrobium avium]|uniref:GTP cyclohydrolase-2 n=1 Tax=Ornithinimicrobium avium TaxID=2283195 RepID=A0A345NPF7_9MICO|nr:GTP cyclohydrolase II [Ornithinimicrobium avium]AXH96915.1 GTP cyclohydrolase II [Ornithinimicrobium avium]